VFLNRWLLVFDRYECQGMVDTIMSDYCNQMINYLKLSQAYRQRSMLPDRHRALLLAAVQAQLSGFRTIAEFCKKQILQTNPGHLLRKFSNMAEALEDTDFEYFADQLRKKIPPDKVELLLTNLGYCSELNRSDYNSDYEFAAAIVGVDAQWIDQNFGE